MHYQLIANIITVISLVLGFSSIFLSINLKYCWASWFILASVLCDIIDGKIARLSATSSEFGKEFDSLVDIVSFGVAAGVLIYMYAFFKDAFNLQDMLVVCLYLTCGVFRLAKFNVYSRKRLYNNYFKGLPITASGAFFASFILVVQRFNVDIRPEVWWLLLLLFSLLMGSNINYPNFRNFKITQGLSGVFLILLSLIAAVISKGIVLLIIFSTYVILSPIIVRDKDIPLQVGNA